MSLRVWLPLNGDLTNNGLSEFEFTNSNSTVSSNGKLGKCYSFNGSSSSIDRVHDKAMWRGYPISFAVWFKSDQTKATGTLIEIAADLSLIYYYDTNGLRFGYWRSYTNSSGNRSGDNQTCSTYFDASVWHHIVVTFNSGINNLYVDGILIYTWDKTATYTDNNPFLLRAGYNKITVGRSYGSSSFVGGLINDVRIYDHALSPKEVKLLSQGLVCHYKLSDPYIEGTTNLCNVQYLPSSGATTWSGHTYARTLISCIDAPIPIDACDQIDITYSGSGGGGVGYVIQQNIPVSASTIYTYSCYIKSSVGYATRSVANLLYRYELDASGTRLKEAGAFNASQMIPLGDGWYRCWGTFTTQSSAAKISLYFYAYPDQNAQYCITCWQLEQKDHMTPYVLGTRSETQVIDSSGYNNHAQTWAYDTNSSIESSSETMRNTLSTYVKAGDVQTGSTATGVTFIYGSCGLVQPPTMTIAFWCKPIKGYNGVTSQGQFCTTSNILGVGSGTDYSTTAMHHRDGRIDMCTSTNIHKYLDITFTKDEWHHYAIVYDGRYGKTYKDGVLQSSTLDMGSTLSLASFTAVVIGYSHAGGVYRKNNSYYSDFRLYATALSQEDIQELYNTPVSVANTGAMMTQGEFVEVVT